MQLFAKVTRLFAKVSVIREKKIFSTKMSPIGFRNLLTVFIIFTNSVTNTATMKTRVLEFISILEKSKYFTHIFLQVSEIYD